MGRAATIHLPPLGKRNMAELVEKAKRLGMQPAVYAKQLVEEGLAIQREAEASTFAEIMGPVREAAGEASDTEIRKLVETARTQHHASGRKKKR